MAPGASASSSSSAKRPAAVAPNVAGEDTDGAQYESLSQMWDAELQGGRRSWYAKAASHWRAQEASIDGVLGGYAETHGPDIRESRRFLALLRRAGALALAKGSGHVLDCGAGIGRVTSGLLRHEFGSVDLVEPNSRLLDAAKKELADEPKVGKFICRGLQALDLKGASYDVIWAQWVLLYLTDDDLVAFLRRCQQRLRGRGLICVKENVMIDGNWMVDKEDNSITRTDEHYKAIFERAGLELLHELQQAAWPTDLLPVKMYALRPKDPSPPDSGTVRRRPASAPPDGRPPTKKAVTRKPAAASPAVRRRPAAAR